MKRSSGGRGRRPVDEEELTIKLSYSSDSSDNSTSSSDDTTSSSSSFNNHNSKSKKINNWMLLVSSPLLLLLRRNNTSYARRLFFMLCILGLVLTMKMQSQVSRSIAQLSRINNNNNNSHQDPPPPPNQAGRIITTANASDKTRGRQQQQQQQHHHPHDQIQINQKLDALARALNHDSAGNMVETTATNEARFQETNSNNINRTHIYNVSNTNVPFVYMVLKRVDYLQSAMESLKKSDYPKDRLPVIISHDGRVPEVVDYVEKVVKKDFPHVIQLFHPHSCYEHPHSFPGNDKKLNEGYRGDQYGNPRSPWATCCKHHFTWMLNQVFQMDFSDNDNITNNSTSVDTFLFMEEDYIVAPTVYQAIVAGMNVMHDVQNQTLDGSGFLGLVLDPASGDVPQKSKKRLHRGEQEWRADNFRTGPMTMHRSVFDALKSNAHAAYAYCTFDDYNWDWSLRQMGTKRYLPHTVLLPAQKLVHHIGKSGGMHFKQAAKNQRTTAEELNTVWAGEGVVPNVTVKPPKKGAAGYGGWGHAADHKHCLELFQW